MLDRDVRSGHHARSGATFLYVDFAASTGFCSFLPRALFKAIEEFEMLAEWLDDPFEQAFFVMVQLPYLQPFDDVNKRVSRLAANIPFIKGNLSPLSFTTEGERP